MIMKLIIDILFIIYWNLGDLVNIYFVHITGN